MWGVHHKILKALPIDLVAEEISDRLIVRPVDMWQGDGQCGRLLCDGVFTLDGQHLEMRGECWEPRGVSRKWVDFLHGFRWLRDLRACGSAGARQQAQAMIESWARQYGKPKSFAWRPDLAGERISLWIAHYDFFGADADDEFIDLFFSSLIAQGRHLFRILQAEDVPATHFMRLRVIKGLLYAGLALEGREDWLALALDDLERVMDQQILEDGSHISRSPFVLLQALKLSLEIRAALQAAGHPTPEYLEDATMRMAAAVRFFRYGDRYLGLFQGALGGDVAFMDMVLAQAAVRGKKPASLPDGQYEKAVLGRSLLMMDCGPARAHYAPLAFEMAHGKDRIFVNCGSSDTDADWRDVLSAPAAHNCLVIDGNYAHNPYQVTDCAHHEGDGEGGAYHFIQATHDAYARSYGVLHKRSLYLAQDGHDLRGEDTLVAVSEGGGPLQPHIVMVRFHIHPRVLVSLTADGQSALLRLPSGIGWRFQQMGGYRMRMEDSVYAGDLNEAPRKSKQLVIESAIARDQGQMAVRWALQREGI